MALDGLNGEAAWGMAWPAPAKLNLMLRVVGRRPDGYHDLQTVFQFVELCDWLRFSPRQDAQVVLKTPLPGVEPAEDLTVRAARLLQKESGFEGGIEIAVEKNLPLGGGLGGGSSDAATVLVVLNQLWGLGFSDEQLMRFGVRLGADVPVFIGGESAWAEGVGERLLPVRLPEPWYLIIVPPCQVATREIFTAPDLTRDNKPITMRDFMSGWRGNDCLPLVVSMYPPIRAAMEALSDFAEARLTGTGACIFAVFGSRSEADAAARALKSRWRVFVSKGVNLSPLRQQLWYGFPEGGPVTDGG